MKIAVCFSGFMRTYEKTFANFQQYFLSLYPNDQVDIFVHTWSNLNYDTSTINLDKIEKLYRPKLMVIQPFTRLVPARHERNHDPNRDSNNIFSMFTKIKACNDLKSQYESQHNFKYDCVIRMRPDINLKANLLIKKEDLDKINIPEFGDFFGTNDQMAFSNSANMDFYASLIDRINEYLYEDEMILYPETLMKQHLGKSQIRVLRPSLPYTLLIHNQEWNNEEKGRGLTTFPSLKPLLEPLGLEEIQDGDRVRYRKSKFVS